MVIKLERSLRVIKVIFGSSYLLDTLEGENLPKEINIRHLRKKLPAEIAAIIETVRGVGYVMR